MSTFKNCSVCKPVLQVAIKLSIVQIWAVLRGFGECQMLKVWRRKRRRKTKAHTQCRTHGLQYSKPPPPHCPQMLSLHPKLGGVKKKEKMNKQESILSTGPTVYSTVTPPPHPSTHGQVVFASKRWRYEGKGKGGGEEIKFKKKLTPIFFIGGPLLYPLCRHPPYPLHRVILYFLFPHFFIGGPPPYAQPPPPSPLPLPLAQSNYYYYFCFFYPHFFIGGPPPIPPPSPPPLPLAQSFFFFFISIFYRGHPPVPPPVSAPPTIAQRIKKKLPPFF